MARSSLRLRVGAILLPLALYAQHCLAAWNPESGGAVVRVFTPRNYGASPQNWAAVQDQRGVMFFGNTEGVLEFDGVSWRKIPIGNQSAVRSLSVDAKGTIYVGAQGEFGYLKADSAGALHYTSLLDRVPAEERKFGDVWTIVPAPEGVYFGSYQAIFLVPYDGGSGAVWKPATRFARMLRAGGTIYATTKEEGLLHLRDGKFEPVPGGGDFRTHMVRSLFATSEGLEVIDAFSIYLSDGASFRKASTAIEDLLKQSQVNSAVPVTDNGLMLATARSGLILLGSDRRVDRILRKDSGLLSDAVTSLYLDREGALWITSGAGIERLEATLTHFADSEGLTGNVNSIARYDGSLYVGTQAGLFTLRATRGEAPHFEPVSGVGPSVFALMPTIHGLLAGHRDGVHAVSKGSSILALKKNAIYDIGISPASPDRAWVAGGEGLFEIVWKAGHWEAGRSVASLGEEFRSVVEDPDGNVWVGSRGLILRVRWNGTEPVVDRFTAPQGVPGGIVNPYWWRGKVTFATEKGLLRYNGEKFLPVELPGITRDRPVAIVRDSPSGETWVTGAGYHEVIGPQGARPMPLLRSELTELYTFLPEADGTVWAAGADGVLYRYEPPPPGAAPPLKVEIRRMQSQNGTNFYDGAGALPASPRLSYGGNSLRFEFAAPFFEDPSKVEYRVHLDGADSEWSRWSTETRKDYTHLLEGSYGFEVQARNPHGAVSSVEKFSFSIRPPWYRTWPAYLLWALLAAAALYGVYRWRIRKLVQEKEQLEVTVAERTVEIRKQRDQIQVEQERGEALLLNILPGSVASELKENGFVQPHNFEEVTVCFTDFVGFTLSSQQMQAEALVSSLHEYFTYFDELTEEYGLEKLKTIGDSYMLVSGLPHPRRGHAVNAVLGALRMVEVVEELSHRGDCAAWGVRAGLNTGPVAAGVVGVRKFAYDIWGNTVNMASRMESSGAPGRVNLSRSTYDLVKDFIECEARGQVQTKDKQDQEMFFAVGVHPRLDTQEKFAELYRRRFDEDPLVIPKMRVAAQTSR